MSKLETVTIVNEAAKSGCTVINASDFDADVHEVFEDADGVSIPESPEEIEEMDRNDVIALLKANGVEAPKGKTVDLRAALKKIMFVDA